MKTKPRGSPQATRRLLPIPRWPPRSPGGHHGTSTACPLTGEQGQAPALSPAPEAQGQGEAGALGGEAEIELEITPGRAALAQKKVSKNTMGTEKKRGLDASRGPSSILGPVPSWELRPQPQPGQGVLCCCTARRPARAEAGFKCENPAFCLGKPNPTSVLGILSKPHGAQEEPTAAGPPAGPAALTGRRSWRWRP